MKLLHFSTTLFLIPLLMAEVKNPKTQLEDDFETITEPIIGPESAFNSTDCEEFGKYARFNPLSVVGKTWFLFYYWAPIQPMQLYQFRLPSKQELKLLHEYLDGHMPKRFSWDSTLLLKKELLTNYTTLIEEKGDRGQYLEYAIYYDIPEGKLTHFRNIRLKQTGDNKYFALMACKENTVLVMSQLNAVPPQNKIQEEAARLGFRSWKGKSYLYQGHEWMPIPEMDEKSFWRRHRNLKKYL